MAIYAPHGTRTRSTHQLIDFCFSSALIPAANFFCKLFSFHLFVIFLYGFFTSSIDPWRKFYAVNFPSKHFSNSLKLAATHERNFELSSSLTSSLINSKLVHGKLQSLRFPFPSLHRTQLIILFAHVVSQTMQNRPKRRRT